MSERRSERAAASAAEIPFWSELAEMIALRRQLASWEIRQDLKTARRTAVAIFLGTTLSLSGLVLLLQVLSEQLAIWTNWPDAVWMLLLGSLFPIIGVLAIWIAYRRFRRNLVALRASRAELDEDLTWIREWLGARRPSGS